MIVASSALSLPPLQASQHPRTHEVAAATGVADVTIRIAYRDLRSDAPALVPAWFATPEQLAKLPDLGA